MFSGNDKAPILQRESFLCINTKIPIYLLIDFFIVTIVAKRRKFLLLSKQVLRGCKEDKKQPPKNKGKYSEY